MEKHEVIELLKQALTEIPHLKELRHDNQEFELWDDKVLEIIKAGLDADDRAKWFASGKIRVVGYWTSDADYQEYYLENLDNYDTALKKIIQKYELPGFEAEPAARAKQPGGAAEAPDYLFDKMQFHPRVIAVSKPLFVTGQYALAILEAFKAVNNFVKEKTVLSLDGKALMSKVFNENAPIIRLNELLSQSDRDEQEGFKFLLMGAMVGIRNPKAHDNVVQTDAYRTLEYLGFASLLMKRVEEGKVAPLQKDVQNI